LFQSAVWELQLASAKLASALLRIAGVAHSPSGISISRGDAVFLVAEPCSGLQGIVTLTLIAVLVRELHGAERRRSLLVVLIAPIVAFALNAVRVAWIACLDPVAGEAASHTSQGLSVLVGGSLVLYGAGLLLSGALAGPTLASSSRENPEGSAPWRLCAGAAAVLAALSLLPPAKAPRRAQPDFTRIERVSPAGWKASERPVDRSFLGTLSIGSIESRRYARPGESVDLVVAADVGLPTRSPFSPKGLLPGREFEVEGEERRCHARLVRCIEVAVVRDARERRLVYYWHYGDPGYGADLVRELSGIDSTPFADSRPRGFVQLSTPVDAVRPAARQRAEQTLDRFLLAYASQLREIDASATQVLHRADGAG
jgi:exosortase/archaeosortase family protein